MKYPNASREWAWRWLFPATRFYLDLETNGQEPGYSELISAPEGQKAQS